MSAPEMTIGEIVDAVTSWRGYGGTTGPMPATYLPPLESGWAWKADRHIRAVIAAYKGRRND